MNGPIGAPIIGTGFEADDHAEQLARLGHCAITAVLDIDEPKATVFGARHGSPKAAFGESPSTLPALHYQSGTSS